MNSLPVWVLQWIPSESLEIIQTHSLSVVGLDGINHSRLKRLYKSLIRRWNAVTVLFLKEFKALAVDRICNRFKVLPFQLSEN